LTSYYASLFSNHCCCVNNYLFLLLIGEMMHLSSWIVFIYRSLGIIELLSLPYCLSAARISLIYTMVALIIIYAASRLSSILFISSIGQLFHHCITICLNHHNASLKRSSTIYLIAFILLFFHFPKNQLLTLMELLYQGFFLRQCLILHC